MKKTLQTARSVKAEEERELQALERRSPAACGEDKVRQAVPLQSMQVQSRADTPLQPWGTPWQCQSQGHAQRRPGPMGRQHWSRTCGSMARGTQAATGFQAGFVKLWKPCTKANCSWRTCPMEEGIQLQQVMQSCSLWEGLNLEKFLDISCG